MFPVLLFPLPARREIFHSPSQPGSFPTPTEPFMLQTKARISSAQPVPCHPCLAPEGEHGKWRLPSIPGIQGIPVLPCQTLGSFRGSPNPFLHIHPPSPAQGSWEPVMVQPLARLVRKPDQSVLGSSELLGDNSSPLPGAQSHLELQSSPRAPEWETP